MAFRSCSLFHPSRVPKRSKKARKTFQVRVTTLDAVLDFDCHLKSTGRDLFDLVCRTLGLREIWYFGLQFTDSEGFVKWLKLGKKVVHQNTGSEIPIPFVFLAKFYPVDIAQDIVLEATRHLFFLQVKQSVLNMNIYCPPEISVLLASYALQAKYGDFGDTSFQSTAIVIQDFLPQSIIDQFSLTPEMWMDRINVWYADHQGMSSDEAETEFLKLANHLSMFGVNYFSVSDREKTKQWLGITSSGVHIYEQNNKLSPSITLEWKDMQEVSFCGRKLIISLLDRRSPPFKFYVSSVKGCKLFFDLYVGNHEIFKRKQSPESVEMQQMKIQDREAKEKLQIERRKVARERQIRVEAEKEKAILQQKINQYHEQAMFALNALRRCEVLTELLAEKAQVSEEEVRLLTEKVFEIEAESRRAKICALSSQMEKTIFERKARATELLLCKSAEESKVDKEFLISELVKKSEKVSSYCLNCISTRNFFTVTVLEPFCEQLIEVQRDRKHISVVEDQADKEVERLKAEILEENFEYNKRSEQLLKQLQELRSELEVLQVEDQLHL